jgi:hypothetical protein
MPNETAIRWPTTESLLSHSSSASARDRHGAAEHLVEDAGERGVIVAGAACVLREGPLAAENRQVWTRSGQKRFRGAGSESEDGGLLLGEREAGATTT